LQEQGCWVIMPARGVVKGDVGALVLKDMGNGHGEVLAVANTDMMFDMTDFGTSQTEFKVILPRIKESVPIDDEGASIDDHDDSDSLESLTVDEEDCHYLDDSVADEFDESDKESTVVEVKYTQKASVYGLPKGVTVEEKVLFCHCVGHWNKKTMIAMANGSVDNFPLTVEQVKKYFPEPCACCIKGQYRKRSANEHHVVPHAGYHTTADAVSDKADFQLYNMFTSRRVEGRNLIIGAQIGLDFFGPILEASMLVATDKASGYMFTVPVPKNGKKDTVALIQKILDHYARYGHHKSEFNVPIIEVRCDSDKLFLSKEVDKLMSANGIKVIASPPDVHELNGLAERSNQTILNKCRMAFAQAKHCPEILWPLCWEYQVVLYNLCLCPMFGNEHKTRHEVFTGEKPDFGKTPYLPFGTVVEFPIHDQKTKFAEKTSTGVFVGLSKHVESGILIYSLATKKVVSRSDYRVLMHVPDPWKQLSPKLFTLEHEKDELDALLNDSVHEDALLGKDNGNRLEVKYLPMTEKLDKVYLPTQPVAEYAPHTTPASVPTSTLPNVLVITAPPAVVPPVEDAVPNIIIGHEGASQVVTPSVPAVVQAVVNQPVNPAVPSTTAARAKRDKKQDKKKNKRDRKKDKANLLVSPLLNKKSKEVLKDVIVDGVTLSTDEDLHFQFMRNCGKMVFPVVRMHGRRVRLSYSPSANLKKCRQKLMRFIRRTVKKKKSSKDSPTLAEAKKRKDWPKFLEAINLELEQLKLEGVFGDEIKSKDVVRLGIKVIGSMLVLTVKRKPDGSIDKYNARLVALGNQQSYLPINMMPFLRRLLVLLQSSFS